VKCFTFRQKISGGRKTSGRRQRPKVTEGLVVFRRVPIAHRVRLNQPEHQVVGQLAFGLAQRDRGSLHPELHPIAGLEAEHAANLQGNRGLMLGRQPRYR
jgi:hypothetical protein